VRTCSAPQQRAKAIGVQDRPLGPARFEFITGEDLYRAALDHVAYRARALDNANLAPNVVVGQHGWWQACPELGRDGYPPFGDDSANLNLALDQGPERSGQRKLATARVAV
jgi:hypothetical protein